MRKTIPIISIFIMAILLASGCTPMFSGVQPRGTYIISANAIALPEDNLGNKTYVIVSSMKGIDTNDIQFREYAGQVEKALSYRGYTRANKAADADLVACLAYGIGRPKTEVSTQTHNVSGGYSYPIGFTWIHVQPETKTVTTKKTTYDRFLVLEMYNAKDMKTQLWKTILESTGSSSDLRKTLPHMIAVGSETFGVDTKGDVTKHLYINAPIALDVMATPNAYSDAVIIDRLGIKVAGSRELFRPNTYPIYRDIGVIVVEINKGSVAEIMGIGMYDVIVGANNISVYEVSDLVRVVQSIRPGKTLRIAFFNWEIVNVVSRTVQL